jgi:N-formylglutamate deformylase
LNDDLNAAPRKPAAGHLPVVVHVPHASTLVPQGERKRVLLNEQQLAAELLRLTDAHTDELFPSPPDVFAQVRFPISRLIVDPERFEDDELELMSRVGMGVIYNRTTDGAPLIHPVTHEERARLIEQYYRPHHTRLEGAVTEAIAAHGTCLVVDGHSFPSQSLRSEIDQSPSRPDICIGSDPFHTPPELRDRALSAVRSAGLSVALNRPFAGALVPASRYRTDPRVLAVMIEVNRKLYMDEQTGIRSNGFEKTRRLVEDLVRSVSKYVPA